MEFMSFVCIPINIAIIYFAAEGPDTESTIIKELRGDHTVHEPFTNAQIVLIVVLIEHIVMITKAFIAVLIPDVPEFVIAEEIKRVKTLELAQHSLLLFKMENKYESFNDVVSRLQTEIT